MKLEKLFAKPVNRPIEGVIKADDEESLRLELEEYVLTNEVEKRIEDFLEAYNNYDGANGVWISGFFGSGKSHLLKMLALVLENRQVDGEGAFDLFKPKCKDNAILSGLLSTAVQTPSKSILFNIDQKADVISKTEIDALLSVFVKVFDEMCGYYGKQGHIARFERDLDSSGRYEEFKSKYAEISDKPWEKGRQRALIEARNISEAFAAVTGGSAEQSSDILDKYRGQYSVSIEDFAEQINEYIEQKPASFRLNFFVDEVGQFIADNTKLMTNLQTIAESLATRCKGRAWVIVTAQEEMKSIIGDMSTKHGNDFSKIQDRFSNRMKLTSADVAEVIQRRLLAKTGQGEEQLDILHGIQHNNFKTLFDFTDGSQTFHNFKDQAHFKNCYPFVPYQFALFQSAIQSLSEHSAFEGKSSSVGERSMLGVFQQVAVHISDHEVGELATFDLMFEGIRTALKASVQTAITMAEKHLANPFAVKVLKVLFLVKYVNQFKPTVRNLSVLMLPRFDADLGKLRSNLTEALDLLEQQTYIQRHGELFEYLTDDEKDVEQEIKNTNVDTADLLAELEKLVFDSVIRSRKIRSEETKQDYSYTRKIDDKNYGREYELSINIITPFNENSGNEQILTMQSMGRAELLVLLPPDDRLMHDLEMFKRTEKYISQNVRVAQQGNIQRILVEKGSQNQQRYGDMKSRITELLGRAALISHGAVLDIGGEDAESRITRGFHQLLTRIYPNLGMLRGTEYNEAGIAAYLSQGQQGLLAGDATALAESEQEMLAHVASNKNGGVRTTVKSLLEHFERRPYGWYYAAMLCTLASLCARGKIEIRIDSAPLDDEDLLRAITNSAQHANAILEPQAEFSASQVRALKEFHGDFFDQPPKSNEAKALGREVATRFVELLAELKIILATSEQYPFLTSLIPATEEIAKAAGKPYTWYLTELLQQEDKLLDIKEQQLDPVRKFMGGSQRKIYDEAAQLLREQQANFDYIPAESPKQLQALILSPDCYRGTTMQQIKAQLDQMKTLIDEQRKREVDKATASVQQLQSRLQTMQEFQGLTDEQKQQVESRFSEAGNTIKQQTLIPVVREKARVFEDRDYASILDQVSAWRQPAPSEVVTVDPPDTQPQADNGDGKNGGVQDSRAKYVAVRQLPITFNKAWLASEADVDEYLKAVRSAMLQALKDGKRVRP